MATFRLEQVDDVSVFETAHHVHTYTMDLAASADEVWGGLTATKPLTWCRALDGEYTSPRPYGVGTTRRMTAAKTLKLQERFFFWDDVQRRHCFTVVSANVPGFRLFAEDYQVTPTDAGCRFVWSFASEARPGFGGPFRLIDAATKLALLDGFERDTLRHFGRA